MSSACIHTPMIVEQFIYNIVQTWYTYTKGNDCALQHYMYDDIGVRYLRGAEWNYILYNSNSTNNAHIHLCRNLRKTTHAKLLVNLCLALVGLYAIFIVSTVSTGVPVLCALASALLHYFFLVVFFWMAAEAIHLHRKLVTVFKPDIKWYLYIAMAVCWGMLIGAEDWHTVHTICTHFAQLLIDIHC